jgi:hypothetical protein
MSKSENRTEKALRREEFIVVKHRERLLLQSYLHLISSLQHHDFLVEDFKYLFKVLSMALV